jgi:hypothetical protein
VNQKKGTQGQNKQPAAESVEVPRLDRIIRLRLTTDDYNFCQRMAKNAGMNLSDWFRDRMGLTTP